MAPQTGGRASAVSLLLGGSMCLLPFLVPYHQPPMLSFYPEWMAAALGVAAFIAAAAGRGLFGTAMPIPVRWIAGFGLYLALCAVVRDPVYPQMSLWAIAYATYAVLMLWLAACLVAEQGLGRVVDVLAACILAGAIANAGAGMIQFYGRPLWLQDLVAELHGARAYGNVAQPNLYANYLALGQASLLYFWVRGRVGTALCSGAAVLLVWGTALSESRSALLFVFWFALLGGLSARLATGDEMRRLRGASFALAGGLLAAYIAEPWVNSLVGIGPAGPSSAERFLSAASDLRWPAWMLALRIFSSAPLAGIGVGGFAGAAFAAGLPLEMADKYEVWTSPHNLVLQLLAETGLVGAALVLAAIAYWCRQAWRIHRSAPRPATWWLIASAGVELIHSMLEFPLWSADFLGITALLMGCMSGAHLGACALRRRKARALLRWICGTACCAGLALMLALGMNAYWRLDLIRVTGAGGTLAGSGPTAQARALRQLGHGLLAPLAEFWLCRGAPLDRDNLSLKLAWSGRVLHYFPSAVVVARRAAFLMLAGRMDDAIHLVDHFARHASTKSRQRAAAVLGLTQGADPDVLSRLLARLKRGVQRPRPLRRGGPP